MEHTIILKECNRKNDCGIKRCVHNKPHNHYDSCTPQICFDGKLDLHCRCLKSKYKLIKE